MKRITGIAAVVVAASLLGGSVLAQPRGQGRHWMGGGGYGQCQGMPCAMAEELDLTQDQRDAIREIADRHRDGALGELSRTGREARRALGLLIHDPGADEQAVLDAARRLSEQSEQMALERHRMHVEINGVLTEEQRVKAQEMMKERADDFDDFDNYPPRRRGRFHHGG
jgi:Spy/CpxP family protein refolding chaperone